MVQALEASLKRLNTDYVDVYWLHAWDFMTPVDEIIRGLDDLVRAGKVLYVGISDTPAWVVAQANTLADPRLVALRRPADPLQPGRPGGRARAAPHGPRPRSGRHSMERAGRRRADRQVRRGRRGQGACRPVGGSLGVAGANCSEAELIQKRLPVG